MATNGRKRRRKIPYIGKPLTASEILAAYPPLPPKIQAIVDRAYEEMRAERPLPGSKRSTSGKTVRAK
jgi:hypothetical protein